MKSWNRLTSAVGYLLFVVTTVDGIGDDAPRPQFANADVDIPSESAMDAEESAAGPQPVQDDIIIDPKRTNAPIVLPDSQQAELGKVFEVLVYGGHGSEGIGAARHRMEQAVLQRIHELEQTSELTNTQRDKLRLAGLGDIAEVFQRTREMQRRFERQFPKPFHVRDLMNLDVETLRTWQAISDDSFLEGRLFRRYRQAIQPPTVPTVVIAVNEGAQVNPYRFNAPRELCFSGMMVMIDRRKLRATGLTLDQWLLHENSANEVATSRAIESEPIQGDLRKRLERDRCCVVSHDIRRSTEFLILQQKQIATVWSSPLFRSLDRQESAAASGRNSENAELFTSIQLQLRPEILDDDHVQLDMIVEVLHSTVRPDKPRGPYPSAIGRLGCKCNIGLGQCVILSGFELPNWHQEGCQKRLAGNQDRDDADNSCELVVILKLDWMTPLLEARRPLGRDKQ